MSESRCDGSPSSKSKRSLEIRSEPVVVVQEMMFTWWSASAADTSRSRRARSRALTSIDATKNPDGAESHSTSIRRSF
jgi:hypothetical protein